MKVTSLLLMAAAGSVAGFAPVQTPTGARSTAVRGKESTSVVFMAGGFDKTEKPVKKKSEGQKKREAESSKYDELAATGGQEYSIYVRQFGSDDKSWFPCGAIAVPRGAQVSDAIYANVEALKTAIVRTYPKLKGFEDEFEFGFNLKIFPDDEVEVAMKNKPREEGMTIGNWLSTLFSPVDASQAKPPTN